MCNESKKVLVDTKHLAELLYWARRYCDRRSTYAPSSFNSIYNKITKEHPCIKEIDNRVDETLTEEGAYWPYAQDGMHDKEKGFYDARAMIVNVIS